jgi:hypothetical protein
MTTYSWRDLSTPALLAIGSRISASKSRDDLVAWAARILSAATELHPEVQEVEAVINATRDPKDWSQCKRLFEAVRRQTLAAESSGADPLLMGLLLLAENVAKVTYNATGVQGGFDADAGDWIPVCAADMLSRIPDPAVGARLEGLLNEAAARAGDCGPPSQER